MFKLYAKAIKSSSLDLVRNWIVILGSIVLFVLGQMAVAIFSPLGIVGGFIIGMIHIVLISYYYSWIANSQHRQGLKFKELLPFSYSLFYVTIGVAFIHFIFSLLVGSFAESSGNHFISLAFSLLVIFLFNPIPEVLHQKQYDGIYAIKESFDFMKQFWLEWLPPLIIMCLPILLYHSASFPLVLAGSHPLLPISIVFSSFGSFSGYTILGLLPTLIIGHWYMLFRARLFGLLSP